MADEDVKAELAALRAEVAALVEARRQDAERRESPPPEGSPANALSVDEAHEGFVGQVQEIIELLEHEIKETPVVAGIAGFVVGVVVGRLLR